MSRALRRIALLLVACGVFVGCSEQATSPAEEKSLLEEAAEVRVEPQPPESVKVLDDERSLARRIEDATIETQIRLALVEAEELRTFDFEPVVVNGTVLLQGTVLTRDQRSRAAELARKVEGVREVVNEVVSTEEPVIAESTPPPADDDGASSIAPGEDLPGTATEKPDVQTATYHTVKTGDNLWEIARHYGVSVSQVQQLNDLRSNSIKPGQRLRVK